MQLFGTTSDCMHTSSSVLGSSTDLKIYNVETETHYFLHGVPAMHGLKSYRAMIEALGVWTR